jgi:hypothetical protein
LISGFAGPLKDTAKRVDNNRLSVATSEMESIGCKAYEGNLHLSRCRPDERETTQSETQSKHQDIAKLAYALWQQRGCPEGSAEQDWYEAEQTMRGIEQPSALSRP